MSSNNHIALSLCAHPDDAELLCVGTLALLKQRGWEIHIATMTPGNCGSVEYNRDETTRIRKAEAAEAARLMDAEYHCLDFNDHFFFYDEKSLMKTMELVRRLRPGIVLTHCPQDYIFDHINTGNITMTATFTCGMPNIEIKDVSHFEPIPYLYYLDAIEGKDRFGKDIPVDMLVDISSTIDCKEKTIECHHSQRDWMLKHHGVDNFVQIGKDWSAKRGTIINKPFAEGFRQHLGHPFPQDNILKSELGDLVHLL